MNEIRAPLTQEERARVRFDRLVGLHAQAEILQLQIRQETAALVEQDTPFALRSFVADELAMTLAESPGTCGRRIDDARVLMAHPRLTTLVADSVATVLDPAERVVTGWFGMRHADAVLSELVGASDEVQSQVLDLVLADEAGARTPHQLRKAVRAARLLHDLEGAADKQDRIHDGRGVSLLDEYDGSATLMVGGTKTRAAAMLAAIDAHVAVPTPGDARTLGQRRYDFVMDLLCGRVQATAPWQALIVVSLETLEGGDAPAEIPGLGLVTADEAREVLAQADLRRAVVDHTGALIALDDTVLTGDQQPLMVADQPEVSLETEPAPVVAEETATVQEWAWLAAQDQTDPAEAAHHEAHAARREAQLLQLCARGTAAIEAHLHAQARAQALAAAGWTVRHAWPPPDDPEPDPPPEAPQDPPQSPEPPSGGSGPPRPRPHRPGDGRGNHPRPPTQDSDPGPHQEPDPPTWADRDWHQIRENQDRVQDQLDQLAHSASRSVLRQPQPAARAPSLIRRQQREGRLRRQAAASRWTSPGLRAAVSTLRTATPSPVPAASRGYPFRGRLARWIRTRDVTCTFPGCQLLAQRCQLDHVLEYPKGNTEHCNGACECVHHHQAKHASMTVTRLDNGTMRWTNRFGITRTRPPRPLLRGW